MADFGDCCESDHSSCSSEFDTCQSSSDIDSSEGVIPSFSSQPGATRCVDIANALCNDIFTKSILLEAAPDLPVSVEAAGRDINLFLEVLESLDEQCTVLHRLITKIRSRVRNVIVQCQEEINGPALMKEASIVIGIHNLESPRRTSAQPPARSNTNRYGDGLVESCLSVEAGAFATPECEVSIRDFLSSLPTERYARFGIDRLLSATEKKLADLHSHRLYSGLNEDYLRALYCYTYELREQDDETSPSLPNQIYSEMNTCMRNHCPDLWAPLISHIQNGLWEIPAECRTVYRGVGVKFDVEQLYRPGNCIVWPAFSSSSSSRDVAMSFIEDQKKANNNSCPGTLFVIRGVSCRPIQKISALEKEQEYLFPYNSKFRVIGFTPERASSFIGCQIIELVEEVVFWAPPPALAPPLSSLANLPEDAFNEREHRACEFLKRAALHFLPGPLTVLLEMATRRLPGEARKELLWHVAQHGHDLHAVALVDQEVADAMRGTIFTVAQEISGKMAALSSEWTGAFDTLLHCAIESSPEVALMLLDRLPSEAMQAPGTRGLTPLQLAASLGRDALIKPILRSLGTSALGEFSGVDARKGALHCAAVKGQAGVVEIVIEWLSRQPGTAVEDALGAPDSNGNTPLHCAIENQNESIALCLIELMSSEQRSISNHFGNTALHLAALHGTPAIIRRLLCLAETAGVRESALAEVNMSNFTPLHFAAVNGNADAVRMLANAGGGTGDSVVPRVPRVTPLYLACAEGHAAAARVLLMFEPHTAAVQVPETLNTAVHIALEKGYENICLALLAEEGLISMACLGVVNAAGNTPLHIALEKGLTVSAATLLRLCPPASLTLQGWNSNTPLHLAAKNGIDAAVEYLLERTPPESWIWINKDQNAPLHLACRGSRVAAAAMLIDRLPAESLVAKGFGGNTPLHRAAEKGSIEICRLLYAKLPPSALYIANKEPNLPLHLAIKEGHSEVITFLLEHMDHSAYACPGWNKNTPLHAAELHDQIIISLQLIDHLLPEDLTLVNKDGNTPLHLAARKGHSSVVERLLAALPPDSVGLRGYENNTPLHRAAEKGYTDIVVCLLEHAGASAADVIASRNNDHKSPLDVAEKAGHTEIVELLRAVASGRQGPLISSCNVVPCEGSEEGHVKH